MQQQLMSPCGVTTTYTELIIAGGPLMNTYGTMGCPHGLNDASMWHGGVPSPVAGRCSRQCGALGSSSSAWGCLAHFIGVFECTMEPGGWIKPPCITRYTPTMNHHAHGGGGGPPALGRHAGGPCRCNCAGTCKQQSDGLIHHI